MLRRHRISPLTGCPAQNFDERVKFLLGQDDCPPERAKVIEASEAKRTALLADPRRSLAGAVLENRYKSPPDWPGIS
jgi:hypothetical protein